MQSSMNILLPEPMKQWVEAQVSAGGYSTTSEFFRQLVRAEQQRLNREQIDKNLHAALGSGDSTPLTRKDRIRHQGRKRIAAKKHAQK